MLERFIALRSVSLVDVHPEFVFFEISLSDHAKCASGAVKLCNDNGRVAFIVREQVPTISNIYEILNSFCSSVP